MQNIPEANHPSIESESTSPRRVVVYGEVLFDCFPDGRRVLGGAPFNVSWGLKGFGHDPLFISSVGNDEDGEHVRHKMVQWGMSDQGLQTCLKHATGEVHITINDNEPSYNICMPRAWDAIDYTGIIPDGILYHGLLALRSKHSLETLNLLTRGSSSMRFFDVNLRPPYYSVEMLRKWVVGANWLKLNIDELSVVLDAGTIPFRKSRAYMLKLIDLFQVENVLLTAGSEGAMILGKYGEAVCTPAPKLERLVDTVGAGDSFAAYTIHGILSGFSADTIVTNASLFAAKVCGLQGAVSDSKGFYRE